MARIGYIVPEFPGQTHIFFWREIRQLEEMGNEVEIVSTRLPPPGIRAHSWSDEAEERTTYLQERSATATALSVAAAVAHSKRTRWFECFGSISRAQVSLPNRIGLIAMAGFGAKLARIAAMRRWDHMHVHSCANAANITAFASLLSRVPYSLTLHGALSDYGSNQAEKWGNAKFGIAVTRRLLSDIREELGATVAKKTLVAPMGVDIKKFKRSTTYQPWDGQGVARLFSVGRLNPSKGHDVLITAVGLLKARGIPVHLTIAGQDEKGGEGYQQNLCKLIEDLQLSEDVELIGAVPEDNIRDGLLSSHIFVLASLHEAIGVATMEAMALAMPVVATSVGGVPELVSHLVDGFLVAAGDPHDLAAAIETILKNRILSQRLASASREKIRRCYQHTRSAEILARNVELNVGTWKEDAA